MTEPASDILIDNIQGYIEGRLIAPQLVDYFEALISRIRKEQAATAKAEADKAVMARALGPFADKIAAFEKGYQEYGHDFSVVPDGLETGVSIGDLRRARAALTGSSTIISDMEAEIERLKAEVRELERVIERGANAILYRELSK